MTGSSESNPAAEDRRQAPGPEPEVPDTGSAQPLPESAGSSGGIGSYRPVRTGRFHVVAEDGPA